MDPLIRQETRLVLAVFALLVCGIGLWLIWWKLGWTVLIAIFLIQLGQNINDRLDRGEPKEDWE
jgi:hypothetical protein